MHASIVRPRFERRADLAVTVSGPIAGVFVGVFTLIISLIIIDKPNIYILIVLLPFFSHVLALSPFSKDGQALLEALYRKELAP
jgi:ABC-type Na+ efflux pump permease subunit